MAVRIIGPLQASVPALWPSSAVFFSPLCFVGARHEDRSFAARLRRCMKKRRPSGVQWLTDLRRVVRRYVGLAFGYKGDSPSVDVELAFFVTHRRSPRVGTGARRPAPSPGEFIYVRCGTNASWQDPREQVERTSGSPIEVVWCLGILMACSGPADFPHSYTSLTSGARRYCASPSPALAFSESPYRGPCAPTVSSV